MARKLALTWQDGTSGRAGRWRKKYKGKLYYFSGGRGKSDRESYAAALKKWELTKLRVEASQPRKHQQSYERAIDEWEQVLTWSNRHGESPMAQIAHEKLTRLRTQLEAPALSPLKATDQFNARFEPPTVSIPDDLFNKAAEDLASFTLSRPQLPESTDESRKRFVEELDGSPLRIQKEIWRDRFNSQRRRSAIRDDSLRKHVEEFIAQKESEVAAGKLSAGRVYAINLHLSHFQNWMGQDTAVIDIDSTSLRKYHASLVSIATSDKWSTTTARNYIVSLKAFIRWLWQIEAIASLPRVLDGKSDVLNITAKIPDAVIYTTDEIKFVLSQAKERTKLFVLLMLNCGMTQKDISDLLKKEIDWENGRIVRKRSKTASAHNVPTVSYLLWPETLRLLKVHHDDGPGERALLNSNNLPLWTEQRDKDGKYKKTDNIKNAFDRLKAKTSTSKPLKAFKKSSASRLRDNEKYNGVEDLFLGHAPQKMSDKHYTTTPQRLLDSAICWLATEYGLASPSDK